MEPLAGFRTEHAWRRGSALATLWPGAVCHVQHESVKAAGLSHWQVSTPRLQVRHLERP